MKITINNQILAGNLGDGWKDNDEAADSLAVFTKQKYTEIIENEYPGAEINIEIDVAYNTSGCSRTTTACCTPPDYSTEEEIEMTLDGWGDAIWLEFCEIQTNDLI